MVIAGSAMILALLERYPILVWGGAAILGWVAGDIFASDPVVLGRFQRRFDRSAIDLDGADCRRAACVVLSAICGGAGTQVAGRGLTAITR